MNKLKNTFGFSLIELLVSMGLASVLALGIMSLNNVMNKSSVTSNAEYQADLFRKQISALLQNRVAWKNTLNGASNTGTFSCITGSTDCTSASSNGPDATKTNYQYYKFSIANGACSPATTCNGGFNVYDASNAIYYNVASDSTLGFDSTGSQCRSGVVHGSAVAGFPGWTGTTYNGNVAYSTNTQASMCPFRLVLYWVPICPNTTGTCYSPMIHVIGYTLYTPYNSDKTHNINFNPLNYGINLILPPAFL